MKVLRVTVAVVLFASAALAQAGDYVLVLNKTSNTLSFINTATLKAEASVPVGSQPHELAINPARTKAYVSNVGANSLSVIDLKNRTETNKINSPDFKSPHGIVFTADSKRAFVTSEQNKKIFVLDAVKDEIVQTIDTDQEGTHMAVLSPDGRWAYFTNRLSNTISIVDVNAMKIVANVPAGKGVEGIAVSPDGKQVWGGNRGDNTVTVIDTGKREPIASLVTGRNPIRVAFSPDGKRAYVTASMDNEVDVYDVATRKQVQKISVGGSPGGVIFSKDGKRAFVACASTNDVNVIDTGAGTVISKVPVEQGPDGVGYLAQK